MLWKATLSKTKQNKSADSYLLQGKKLKKKTFLSREMHVLLSFVNDSAKLEMSDKRLVIIYPTRDLPITTPYFLSILCAIA